MIYYDGIDFSEVIGVHETSASKEFDVCHYWYFLYYRSTFQTNVCNNFQDLFLMSVNLRDITILKIKGSDYHSLLF